MTFDIAIVTHNTDFYLLNLLDSIRTNLPREAIGTCHVWDNASTDATRTVLEKFARDVPWLEFHLSPVNVYHGPALDRLLRDHCRGEWVLVLDSDTRVCCDFRAALPLGDGPPPAFIGQVQAEVDHLYAYLCHLLVNRQRYDRLPGFVHDGAPGVAFFRAVQDQAIPWARFRWVDFVEHYGQGTLRRLVEREDRSNDLYEWAVALKEGDPTGADAAKREAGLRRKLVEFVGQGGSAARRNEPTVPSRKPLRHHLRRLLAGLRRRADRLERYLALMSESGALRVAASLGIAAPVERLRAVISLLRSLRPLHVLEIGTGYGGTFFLWTWAADPDATLISVDLPIWEADDPGEELRRSRLQASACRRQRVEVLRADPASPTTRAAVEHLLAGARLDFLFVANSTEETALQRCLESYVPLVRDGGYVAVDTVAAFGGAPLSVQAVGDLVPLRERDENTVRRAARDCGSIIVFRRRVPA